MNLAQSQSRQLYLDDEIIDALIDDVDIQESTTESKSCWSLLDSQKCDIPFIKKVFRRIWSWLGSIYLLPQSHIFLLILNVVIPTLLAVLSVVVFNPNFYLDKSLSAFSIPNHPISLKQSLTEQLLKNLIGGSAGRQKRSLPVNSNQTVRKDMDNHGSGMHAEMPINLPMVPVGQHRYWKILFFYAANPGYDLADHDTLHKIRNLEQYIWALPEFQAICHRLPREYTFNASDSRPCAPPNSIISAIFPSKVGDMELADGGGPEVANLTSVLRTTLVNPVAYTYFGSAFKYPKLNENVSLSILRSCLRVGLPAPGFDHLPKSRETKAQQETVLKGFIAKLTHKLLAATAPMSSANGSEYLASENHPEFEFLFGGTQIYDTLVDLTLKADLTRCLISLGMIAILLFVFMEQSLWMTIWCLIALYNTFALAFFAYHTVLGISKMNILNGSATFLVIGIGVDDAFVFYCYFGMRAQYVKKMKALSPDSDISKEDAVKLLRSTLWTSSRVTFFTTFTTAIAFASNILSSIPAIQNFSVFVCLVVSCCWLSVFTTLPSALFLWYCWIRPLEKKCLSRTISFLTAPLCSKGQSLAFDEEEVGMGLPVVNRVALKGLSINADGGAMSGDGGIISPVSLLSPLPPDDLDDDNDPASVLGSPPPRLNILPSSETVMTLASSSGSDNSPPTTSTSGSDESLQKTSNIDDIDHTSITQQTSAPLPPSNLIHRNSWWQNNQKHFKTRALALKLTNIIVIHKFVVLAVIGCVLAFAISRVCMLGFARRSLTIYRPSHQLQKLLDIKSRLYMPEYICESCHPYFSLLDAAHTLKIEKAKQAEKANSWSSPDIHRSDDAIAVSPLEIHPSSNTTIHNASIHNVTIYPHRLLKNITDFAILGTTSSRRKRFLEENSTTIPNVENSTDIIGNVTRNVTNEDDNVFKSPLDLCEAFPVACRPPIKPRIMLPTDTTIMVVFGVKDMKLVSSTVDDLHSHPGSDHRGSVTDGLQTSIEPVFDSAFENSTSVMRRLAEYHGLTSSSRTSGISSLFETFFGGGGIAVDIMKVAEALEQLCQICVYLAERRDLVVNGTARCFPMQFLLHPAFLGLVNRTRSCSRALKVLNIDAANRTSLSKQFWSNSNHHFQARMSRRGRWMTLLFQSTFDPSDSAFQGYSHYHKWEAALSHVRDNIVGGFNATSPFRSVYQTCKFWPQMFRQVSIVLSALYSVVISVLICALTVSLITGHAFLVLPALITIVATCITTLAIFQLFNWSLGAIEAVSASLIVGSAVDYCLHVTEAFLHADVSDWTRKRNKLTGGWGLSHASASIDVTALTDAQLRHIKLKTALMQTLGSVTSSFVTTLAAAIPMATCDMIPFSRFGQIIGVNSVVSYLYSVLLLPALLAVFGPPKHKKSLKTSILCFLSTLLISGLIAGPGLVMVHYGVLPHPNGIYGTDEGI